MHFKLTQFLTGNNIRFNQSKIALLSNLQSFEENKRQSRKRKEKKKKPTQKQTKNGD